MPLPLRHALIGLVALTAGLAVLPPPAHAALPDRGTVIIVKPAKRALITKRSVRVVLRINRPVRRLRVHLGRRDVTKRLRSVGRNRRRGVISGLRPGRNVLHVSSVARNGRRGSAVASVIYARRQHGLVRVRAPRRSSSPVRVSARVPRDTVRFAAWLNGKRVDQRFAMPGAASAAPGCRPAIICASAATCCGCAW